MTPFTESATLPRGFRYHGRDGERPTTPEAHTEELRQPSPPRQPKMKLKRRNHQVNMSGPTEQFLASVAAADIPLPTIEVPDDQEMLDRSATPLPLAGFLAPQPRASPPKTPLPEIDTTVGLGSMRKRDWYNENGVADEISRPSSALSNPSDYSDDSLYFGSRLSRPSEDGSCTSPDSDFAGPFSTFSSFSKGNGNSIKSTFVVESSEPPELPNRHLRHKSRNDAPWSKDMSDHLWQVYMLYLQDPTVTPFRIGSSFVPPEGVVIRVAREAKRSWKGPKVQRQKRRNQTPNIVMGGTEYAGSPEHDTPNSGSLTPTGELVPTAYPKWPHSSAATRSHLRELCKHDSDGHRRHRFGQSRSPTPFTQDVNKTVRARSPHCYSTKGMALVLATSSAPSMQPDGPLAKLADPPKDKFPAQRLSLQSRARLGSPFAAQTYGPSRSKVFNSMRPSPPRNHSDPSKENQLRSPVNLDRPRSLNGTMKRRAQYELEEELSPTGGLTRASILDEELFRNPEEILKQPNPQRRVRRSRGFTLGDEDMVPRPLFAPAPNKRASDTTPPSYSLHNAFPSSSRNSVGDSGPADARRRLGSPFDESSTGNNTFPRRMISSSAFIDHSIDEIIAIHTPASGTIRRRHGPFATVGSSDFGSRDFGSEIASTAVESQTKEQRLKGLESKLREFNGRVL